MERTLRRKPEGYANGYSPARLLDWTKIRLGLRTDLELAMRLGVHKVAISQIRSRTIPLGAALLLSIHEESGLPTRELRKLMGDRRLNFRMGGIRRPASVVQSH